MIGTVVFFAVFLFIFANSVQMVCTQKSDNTFTCVIEKKLLGQVTTSRRTVNGVIAANIAQDCDDGCSYRTELMTVDGGSEPFDDVYTDRGPVAELTNKINARIKQNDGPTFSVEQKMQLWLLLLLGGLFVMSLGIESLFVFQAAYRWWMNRQQ
jgi:hypothetical protein